MKRLFTGKKEKWLPLCRRLLARLDKVPGIELSAGKERLSLQRETATIGSIRALVDGIEIGLTLPKAAVNRSSRLAPAPSSSKSITHRVRISDASEIDEELLSWIRASRPRASATKARTARRRSTAK